MQYNGNVTSPIRNIKVAHVSRMFLTLNAFKGSMFKHKLNSTVLHRIYDSMLTVNEYNCIQHQ